LWAKLRQLSRKLLVRTGLSDHPVAIDEAAGPLSDRLYLMFQMGAREFTAFNPKPYDRTISLFRVTVPRYDACDALPIWRRAAKSVVVYDIAGDHDTIMYEPHVQSLAMQLSQCLASSKPGD
jgi:thioesterase domain-containing protein